MSFAAQIKAFELKALLAINKKVSNVVEEFFTSIVVLSPSPSHPGKYAKGLLSNQYYPMIGNNFSTALTLTKSDHGIESLSRIKAILAGNHWHGKDNIITLANNNHYAVRAEHLGWPVMDGWSGKVGPYKMVATSLQKIKGKYM